RPARRRRRTTPAFARRRERSTPRRRPPRRWRAKTGDSGATWAYRQSCVTSRRLDGGMNDLRHGPRVAIPRRHAPAQLLTPFRSERVVFRAAFVLRESPIRVDETAVLHAMERRVECTVLDLKHVPGRGANPFGDAESVHRPPREGFQDHDVERALKELEIRRGSVLWGSGHGFGLTS